MTYCTYYVTILDREAEVYDSTIEYIRKHCNDTSKEVVMYVGKRAIGNKHHHDIAQGHTERNHSTIAELCATREKEKMAYEVLRNYHDTQEDMEREEAFWQVSL